MKHCTRMILFSHFLPGGNHYLFLQRKKVAIQQLSLPWREHLSTYCNLYTIYLYHIISYNIAKHCMPGLPAIRQAGLGQGHQGTKIRELFFYYSFLQYALPHPPRLSLAMAGRLFR